MMKNKNGFTLIELLGVLVIMGVIALIALPALSSSNEKTKEEYYDGLSQIILDRGKEYFLDHRTLLPKRDGDEETITVDDLVRLDYIEQPVSTAHHNCVGYVKVRRDGTYQYSVCLKCDDYESDPACEF